MVWQENSNSWAEDLNEIYRLKGEAELQLGHSDIGSAAKWFERAIDAARKRSARIAELRATSNLARLLAKQHMRDKARVMLAEIYDWFTEGFDTPDLKDAKALLDELNR
jgi:predicted ATPase